MSKESSRRNMVPHTVRNCRSQVRAPQAPAIAMAASVILPSSEVLRPVPPVLDALQLFVVAAPRHQPYRQTVPSGPAVIFQARISSTFVSHAHHLNDS